MSSKRKPHYFSAQDDHYKRTKSHHQNHASQDEPPIDKEDVRVRLSLLERTIHDITGSPESFQSHSAEVGSDVMKAAVELGKAFHARNLLSPCENINYVPNPYESSDTMGIGEQQFLPKLPSISDSLLEKAVFTHPGVGNNNEATYDRLEILGDAYIELMATKFVCDKFRELPSGRISQIRESLVKNETLSEFATRYGFDSKALVPRDYLKQPKRWMKTKGDIFEAYVAAIILSNPIDGYKIAEDWLTALWTPQLATTEGQPICSHAKEALAKRIMGKGIKLKYVDEHPPIKLGGGKQTFYTGVYLTGWGWDNRHLGSGQGLNKVIAGDQAARQALQNEQLIDEIMAVKEAYDAKKNGG